MEQQAQYAVEIKPVEPPGCAVTFVRVLDEWQCPDCHHRFGAKEQWAIQGAHKALYRKDGAVDPSEHDAPICTVCGKQSHWHGYLTNEQGEPRRVDRRHTQME
jgi:hypothetical protein